MTPTQAHEALEKIKAEWREVSPGGCKMMSLGALCPCVLCVADRLHDVVDAGESKK